MFYVPRPLVRASIYNAFLCPSSVAELSKECGIKKSCLCAWGPCDKVHHRYFCQEGLPAYQIEHSTAFLSTVFAKWRYNYKIIYFFYPIWSYWTCIAQAAQLGIHFFLPQHTVRNSPLWGTLLRTRHWWRKVGKDRKRKKQHLAGYKPTAS